MIPVVARLAQPAPVAERGLSVRQLSQQRRMQVGRLGLKIGSEIVNLLLARPDGLKLATRAVGLEPAVASADRAVANWCDVMGAGYDMLGD